jgi:hypothetical protein
LHKVRIGRSFIQWHLHSSGQETKIDGNKVLHSVDAPSSNISTDYLPEYISKCCMDGVPGSIESPLQIDCLPLLYLGQSSIDYLVNSRTINQATVEPIQDSLDIFSDVSHHQASYEVSKTWKLLRITP